MATSVFDLFTIGIGPSSSHTVGPMRAARRFVMSLDVAGQLSRTARITVHLYGSLALTGKGHGTDKAVLLGLQGEIPETTDPDLVDARAAAVCSSQELNLLGRHRIRFVERHDLHFVRGKRIGHHVNAMQFGAMDAAGELLASDRFYSVGGGTVLDEIEASAPREQQNGDPLPYPLHCGADLLRLAEQTGLSVSQMTRENEKTWRSDADIGAGLRKIWQAMQDCVHRGCRNEGVLPGGLALERRAPRLFKKLDDPSNDDPLKVLDWVDLFALAVSEENAAGGRVVTAPTNGAAGIVPAVLHYYVRHCPGADEQGVERFLLAAGAIGLLYKENASISGAAVGCQGEVGVACSMAAAGLTEVRGGSVAQVEEAAEIGMEHNLGLTCDPVGGLVQVPCIERNAMGAIKAINASRLALRGTGHHRVSLDKVIATMRQTGADMKTKYKETSLGGLAVNVKEC
ncbi:MAG: L-serine ammonia-lyase [Planctomycetes bacterium]|nr:L-serine ammonia-lyase [Planctomycetota bacterium]